MENNKVLDFLTNASAEVREQIKASKSTGELIAIAARAGVKLNPADVLSFAAMASGAVNPPAEMENDALDAVAGGLTVRATTTRSTNDPAKDIKDIMAPYQTTTLFCPTPTGYQPGCP